MDKPLIISHRGKGQHNYPENTIEACEHVLHQGANALEIDVRFCGSGELVVFHDLMLKRVTGQQGMLFSTTLQDLKKISLVNSENKQVYVPTLREFINHFKGTVPINLDAKVFTPIAGQFAKYIVRAIKSSGYREQFWVSSFNPIFLRTVKYCSWDIKTGYLFKRFDIVTRMFESLWYADYWQPEIKIVTDAFIELVKQHKKDIFVWTQNGQADMKHLLKYDFVKGIITDNPHLYK